MTFLPGLVSTRGANTISEVVSTYVGAKQRDLLKRIKAIGFNCTVMCLKLIVQSDFRNRFRNFS